MLVVMERAECLVARDLESEPFGYRLYREVTKLVYFEFVHIEMFLHTESQSKRVFLFIKV